jgi:hypothetical protein
MKGAKALGAVAPDEHEPTCPISRELAHGVHYRGRYLSGGTCHSAAALNAWPGSTQ